MDHSQFRRFYERNVDRIFRFVLLRVGDRALAEDLVSEVFLKALQAFDRYDETRSKSSWIFTIARNHLANHFRSAGREVTDEDLDDLPVLGKDFGEGAALHHDVLIAKSALAALPPEKQRLIRMKYLEELSYEEMAERLGKDKGALKVATFRAMRDLRAALKGKL